MKLLKTSWASATRRKGEYMLNNDVTVEPQRFRFGDKDEDETVFSTPQEAYDYARKMCLHYGYRVWIAGVEFTRKDFAV
jgi:hypothetical protein